MKIRLLIIVAIAFIFSGCYASTSTAIPDTNEQINYTEYPTYLDYPYFYPFYYDWNVFYYYHQYHHRYYHMNNGHRNYQRGSHNIYSRPPVRRNETITRPPVQRETPRNNNGRNSRRR